MASLVNTLFKNVFWYITQKGCERKILEYPWFLLFVPNKYKTQEMCERAVDIQPWTFKFVPDHLKTLRMCESAFEKNP